MALGCWPRCSATALSSRFVVSGSRTSCCASPASAPTPLSPKSRWGSTAICRGTFAMYITGPWNLGEFRRRLPPELQHAWGTAPLPGPTGAASGVSLAGGASLSIFRAPRHRALATELVEFLSRPEQQARFYRLTGDLPARREAWSDSSLAHDHEAEAFRIQLTRTVPTPMVPEWEQVTTKIMDRTEAAARGAETPAAALAALDADVDRLLEPIG